MEKTLDRTAARRAQSIVRDGVGIANIEWKDVDNLATKTLGVLQENGVYACFLFLFSRSRDKDKKIAEVISRELLGLATEDLPFGWTSPGDKRDSILAYVSERMCANLDALLFKLTAEDCQRLDEVAEPELAIVPYYHGSMIDFKPSQYSWQ